MGLAYERVGSGPPLVLLHGIGHHRKAWQAVTPLLAPSRELILVDLPGHGESPPLELAGRTPVEALAEELVGFLGEQDLERPHLAGNSLGGVLSLIIAAFGHAASATGLSPAGFWRRPADLRRVKTIFGVMRAASAGMHPAASVMTRSRAGRALMYGAIVSRPSQVGADQARGDAVAFATARGTMKTILDVPASFTLEIPADVPVTIAWGTRDRLLPPDQASIARQRLPQARFVSLPGCGHVPMTDDPDLVARVLLEGSAAPAGVPAPTRSGDGG